MNKQSQFCSNRNQQALSLSSNHQSLYPPYLVNATSNLKPWMYARTGNRNSTAVNAGNLAPGQFPGVLSDLLVDGKPLTVTVPGLDEQLQQIVMDSAFYTDFQTILPSDLPNTSLVTTNGWDTVHAIRVSELNKAIISQKTTPGSFSQSIIEEGKTFQLTDGTFDHWQITQGGDGQNLFLMIPIAKGTYITPSGQSYSIAGSKLKVQIKLEYMYQDAPSNNVHLSPGEYHLQVQTDLPLDLQYGYESTKVIYIVEEHYPDAISPMNALRIRGLLETWFNENLSRFNQVFATIQIEKLFSPDSDFAWLKPTFMSYGYHDGPTENDSIFAILCLTGNKSPTGLSHQLSELPFNKEDVSLFLINTKHFIEKCLIPGYTEAMKEDKVTFTQTDRKIYATNFTMDRVKVGALYYYPKVKELSITFNEADISIVQTTTVNLSAGIDVTLNLDLHQTFQLSTNSKKEQIITLVNIGKPVVTQRTEISPWIEVTELVIATIASVCVACITTATDKLSKKMIAVIIAIVVAAATTAVMSKIIKAIITEGISNAMPSCLDMLKSGTNYLVWPLCDPDDQNRYTLTDVAFSNELILKGNPGFKRKEL